MKYTNTRQETGANNVSTHAELLQAQRPEWIRLPRTGSRDPLTGLSRAGLNELVLPTKSNGGKPPVRSISLKKRGATRGTRLIDADSLITFLHGLCEEQNPTNN